MVALILKINALSSSMRTVQFDLLIWALNLEASQIYCFRLLVKFPSSQYLKGEFPNLCLYISEME